MIHTEAWFRATANSREAQEAIERLRRGDTSALQEIHTLWLRGQVKDFEPVKILIDSRHTGHGFEWLERLSEFYSQHTRGLRQAPLPLFELKSALARAGEYLVALRSVGSTMKHTEIPSEGDNIASPWGWGLPLKNLINYWNYADQALTKLEEAWNRPELKRLAGWRA